MRLVDEITCTAPVDVCFRFAADVERWAEVLPHYRWVRFRRKDGLAEGVVEMAAWRPFGPLKYPTWWVSEMSHDAETRQVFYTHIEGITKRMDVVWEVSAIEGGGTHLQIVHEWRGPKWPLIGRLAARWVIGPLFVHHIAMRTLRGIARAAEVEAGRDSPAAGTGDAPDAVRTPRPDDSALA